MRLAVDRCAGERARRAKAGEEKWTTPLPPLSENELNRCSGNTIGFQNEAAIGQYVEKKLNVLTSLLASNLEKQRTGTKIGWATWKADFAKTCNCDTFVKDNAKNRADYCE